MPRPVEETTRPGIARQILAAVGIVAAVSLVAVVGSLLTTPHTDGWYAEAERVPWSPPDWVFGPAWSILYLLIAVSGFLLWRAGVAGGESAPGHRRNRHAGVLALFVAQLLVNGLWSPVFFAGTPHLGPVAWWIALAIILSLIALVIAYIVRAYPRSRAAALLFVPYAAWLLFATTLNIGIIALN